MSFDPTDREVVVRELERTDTKAKQRNADIDRLLQSNAPAWVKRDFGRRLEWERYQAELWSARWREIAVNEGRQPDHPKYVKFSRRPLPYLPGISPEPEWML
jgi:hypothetical protein